MFGDFGVNPYTQTPVGRKYMQKPPGGMQSWQQPMAPQQEEQHDPMDIAGAMKRAASGSGFGMPRTPQQPAPQQQPQAPSPSGSYRNPYGPAPQQTPSGGATPAPNDKAIQRGQHTMEQDALVKAVQGSMFTQPDAVPLNVLPDRAARPGVLNTIKGHERYVGTSKPNTSWGADDPPYEPAWIPGKEGAEDAGDAIQSALYNAIMGHTQTGKPFGLSDEELANRKAEIDSERDKALRLQDQRLAARGFGASGTDAADLGGIATAAGYDKAKLDAENTLAAQDQMLKEQGILGGLFNQKYGIDSQKDVSQAYIDAMKRSDAWQILENLSTLLGIDTSEPGAAAKIVKAVTGEDYSGVLGKMEIVGPMLKEILDPDVKDKKDTGTGTGTGAGTDTGTGTGSDDGSVVGSPKDAMGNTPLKWKQWQSQVMGDFNNEMQSIKKEWRAGGGKDEDWPEPDYSKLTTNGGDQTYEDAFDDWYYHKLSNGQRDLINKWFKSSSYGKGITW